MSGDEIRLLIASGFVSLAVLWLLSTLIWRVSGTWERDLTIAERDSGINAERITLGQLGPLVTGRREVPGGYQELSGFAIGPVLRLSRREHGVRALTAMGFPEAVAKKLDGEVMAKLELRLRGGVLLEGMFMPQKVEFTHQPPRITKSYFLAGQPRRYRKLDAVVVPVEETVGIAG